MAKHIKRGWHFLQIPGPSNTPENIRRAMARPTLDHRGPEFGELTQRILHRLQQVFNTDGNVIIYPSSGTGAWEAAMMNLFSPGDTVLAYETGHFANKWKEVAEKIGLQVEWIPSDWRRGAEAHKIYAHLQADKVGAIKAVMIVHNETSNGVVSNLKEVRKAIDDAQHPALFLVDTVSSLCTEEFQQDAWGVDVAISASQKGLMMPPGLGFNAINEKARKQAQQNHSLHSYWQWERIIDMNQTGYYPYTPASALFFGLDAALDMLLEEGMDAVIARHRRFGEACRIAASAWGLENQCTNPKEYSDSTTALRLPQGVNSNDFRNLILNAYDMSLGKGLGRLDGHVFRIGHLGDFNELMLMATLSGVEMGLQLMKVPHTQGGVQAAMDYLVKS